MIDGIAEDTLRETLQDFFTALALPRCDDGTGSMGYAKRDNDTDDEDNDIGPSVGPSGPPGKSSKKDEKKEKTLLSHFSDQLPDIAQANTGDEEDAGEDTYVTQKENLIFSSLYDGRYRSFFTTRCSRASSSLGR